MDANGWWELHLKKARGECLTPEEQRRYEVELSRHDQDSGIGADIASLRKLRTEVYAIADQNSELRTRVVSLETEVRTIEQALSKPTRHLLGVEG